MTDKKTTLEELKVIMQKFADDRDWGQFHDPKNLSMQIATEAAELMEIFRWTKSNNSDKRAQEKKTAVEEELADILAGMLLFSNRCNIDLAKAFEKKFSIYLKRYPAEKVKGKSLKYTEY